MLRAPWHCPDKDITIAIEDAGLPAAHSVAPVDGGIGQVSILT
jgi:hypothetical protein